MQIHALCSEIFSTSDIGTYICMYVHGDKWMHLWCYIIMVFCSRNMSTIHKWCINPVRSFQGDVQVDTELCRSHHMMIQEANCWIRYKLLVIESIWCFVYMAEKINSSWRDDKLPVLLKCQLTHYSWMEGIQKQLLSCKITIRLQSIASATATAMGNASNSMSHVTCYTGWSLLSRGYVSEHCIYYTYLCT